MAIYPYSFTLPPVNKQDIPSDGVVGEFLGISAGGVLDWLPVSASGSGDMLKSENLSGLADYSIARTNIGLGLTSSPEFANLTLTSPSLASSAPVTISQTWGTTGTYTAFKVVANETATAAAASNLLELWSGATPALKLGIGKGGSIISKVGIIALNGSANAAGLSLGLLFTGYGLGVDANGNTAFLLNGLAKTRCGFGVAVASDQSIGWTNAAHVGGDASLDTILIRDSASGNTLALRNGGAPQTFNVYGTSSSNNTVYERMFMRYTAASTLAFQIGTEQVGATARPLEFLTAGTKKLVLTATGNNTATIYSVANVTANILALRNLSETAKFEFNLNASGNASFAMGSVNVISEAGSSYFNGGNVGIGTTAPSTLLHIHKDQSTDTELRVQNSSDLLSATATINLIGSQGSTLVLQANSTTVAAPDATRASIKSTANVFGLNLKAESTVGTLQFYTGGGAVANERLRITAAGNVGIGTTSPTSKLHVEAASPAVLIKNTSASGYSELLFSNTVVSNNGFWLNGSTTAGYGGASSLNIQATIGPIAFHTASVTNALSIAQSGSATFSAGIAITGSGGLRFPATGYGPFWATSTTFNNRADGVLTISNFAENDFGRLQLGGTTASFPAIKRSTVRIQAVLANDSGFTNIQGKLTTDTDYTATVVTPTGFLTLYDAQGNAYKVPCVAA